MERKDARGIASWLVAGARSAAKPEEVLAELCERLVACGVPLSRVAVFIRTPHPQIIDRRFLWQPGAGALVTEASFEFLGSDDYRGSPVAAVFATGQGLRRRLVDPDCPLDYPILRDFREEGMTDYLVSPLSFTDGTIHVATWCTRQPEGFTAADISAIDTILPPLERVAEVRALHRTATNLLDTYVGHRAGERILAGQIRRGHTERIRAAIWLSDMRGFTALADRLTPEKLIDLLNTYFDCQVPAILAQGGEVLKFMGDGLLAIFTIPEHEPGAAETCRSALAAAREARQRIAALDPSAIAADGPVRFGLALHLGEVLYGNIGGASRLDFTCIGPAVNLAARLEKLTGKLGCAILASEEFAADCGSEFYPLGKFVFSGFSEARTVFALKDEEPHLMASSPASDTQ